MLRFILVIYAQLRDKVETPLRKNLNIYSVYWFFKEKVMILVDLLIIFLFKIKEIVKIAWM